MCPNANQTAIRAYTLHENARKKLVDEGEEPSPSIFFSSLLDEFDYAQSPNVTAAKMRDLAEGGYIERAEPVLFIGECGTGKTHLLTGLCVAACSAEAPGPLHHGGRVGE